MNFFFLLLWFEIYFIIVFFIRSMNYSFLLEDFQYLYRPINDALLLVVMGCVWNICVRLDPVGLSGQSLKLAFCWKLRAVRGRVHDDCFHSVQIHSAWDANRLQLLKVFDYVLWKNPVTLSKRTDLLICQVLCWWFLILLAEVEQK